MKLNYIHAGFYIMIRNLNIIDDLIIYEIYQTKHECIGVLGFLCCGRQMKLMGTRVFI